MSYQVQISLPNLPEIPKGVRGNHIFEIADDQPELVGNLLAGAYTAYVNASNDHPTDITISAPGIVQGLPLLPQAELVKRMRRIGG
ncbi:MAG TPA: hypothetical protein VEA59_03580 [Patescibacteria group bacterium]|nr:hypothetical protein [Patescibacteria group bacterium]